jgi:hypothetical protein
VLRSSLLGLMRELGPNAASKIEIFFARSEDFAEPCSVSMLESMSFAARLFECSLSTAHNRRSPSSESHRSRLLLFEALDAFGGVIGSPFPLDSEIEHLDKREYTICLVGPIFHGNVDGLDFAAANGFHLFRSELR